MKKTTLSTHILSEPLAIGDVQRALEGIYTAINQLSDSVNVSSGEQNTARIGKEGDIRVVKDKVNKIYRIEGKTEDGWISTKAFLQDKLTRVGGAGYTPITQISTSLTDNTTGTVSNTIDDTTSGQKDDIASLAAKINELITKVNEICEKLS